MQHFHFETLDSTNEAAKRMIASGEIVSDACIVASEQTAGRGTKGRTWISPRDAGLYLSVVLLDVAAFGRSMQLITLACGVACAQTLRRQFDIDVRVKPVNDLMLNGGKLGGILTEANVEGRVIASLIVGIGINLRRSELGDVAAPHGPAFVESAIADVDLLDRESLAAAIVEAVAAAVRAVDKMTDDGLPPEWQALMVGD